jgi:beta-carotene ketolase (CrtO type)
VFNYYGGLNMPDYDVIIIGGGINGLTCAAYLGKAGLKTAVVEARGECGAHCDTIEAGIPGFLHNMHATWAITPLSPVISDLELDKYGLELRTTDNAWGITFKDGKNVLAGNNPFDTIDSWMKHSKHDADLLEGALEYMYPNMLEFTESVHKWLFSAASPEIEKDFGEFIAGFFGALGVNCTGKQFMEMNGFQVMDLLFESEYIKTSPQSLGWIAGMYPDLQKIGALGSAVLGLLIGPLFPSTAIKGGSHELTHSLVKAAISNGVEIFTCCPVQKIIVENKEAKGVVLSENAIYPGTTMTANKIVSNISVFPTFIDLIGENHIDPDVASRIKKFSYKGSNLFTVYYALDGAPQFASADFDDGIQQCWMGFLGGESPNEFKALLNNLSENKIHKDIIANFFVTTLADPIQAPPGCHTSHIWFDVPPEPVYWKGEKLEGWLAWDRIKDKLADQIDDTYEEYALGFKKLVKERIVYSPLDQYRNNPSAIYGNAFGGSMLPDQFYENRPVPGILKDGGSRTYIKNLYLSNSIHPWGSTILGAGYIAASEVAEDMNTREHDWWNGKACLWFLENAADIPSNLGVK